MKPRPLLSFLTVFGTFPIIFFCVGQFLLKDPLVLYFNEALFNYSLVIYVFAIGLLWGLIISRTDSPSPETQRILKQTAVYSIIMALSSWVLLHIDGLGFQLMFLSTFYFSQFLVDSSLVRRKIMPEWFAIQRKLPFVIGAACLAVSAFRLIFEELETLLPL